MPKSPYERVRNADQRSDVFIRTPYWTPEVEEAFEVWRAGLDPQPTEEILDLYLREEVAVSFKTLNGSVCCTLAHQASKDHDLPYLLTGWSDNALDALAVATYKLEVMLGGVWQAPPAQKPSRRH
jgi:hypothetical protein